MNKKDFIEAQDWVKKAGALKDEYDSHDDLKKHCTKIFSVKHFSIIDCPGLNIVLVKPEKFVEGGKPENHIKYPPTYKIIKGRKLKRFDQDVIIDELAPVLAEHVDRVGLIKDVLYGQTPSELKELYERVIETKKPSIKQRPGCTFLTIGGKRGPPYTLFVR